MEAHRHRSFKGRFEGGQVIVAQGAGAIVDEAGTAEPATVAALDRLQLRLRLFAWIEGPLITLNANPRSTQGWKITLLELLIGKACAG